MKDKQNNRRSVPTRRPKAPGKKPGRKYTKVVWCYLDPREHDALTEAAAIQGDSRSGYAAKAIMDAVRETLRLATRAQAFEEDRRTERRTKKGA